MAWTGVVIRLFWPIFKHMLSLSIVSTELHRAGPVSSSDVIDALTDAYVRWRCHWVFSPCTGGQGGFLERKKVLCISAQVHLFIYFLCTVMNCTAFWEIEMVHVTIKEQQSAGTQFGKQLEHLKITGGKRSDRVLRRINFLFIIY